MKHVTATMAGTVINVLVNIGDSVNAGQDVIVMESMKMEVPIAAETGGKVAEVKVNVGDFVNEGDTVLVLE
ncbi:acetyl-CoA carboxylase biotin carboxyl carrier protein subunit [Brevibacillus sp. SYP-B805]|uniref:acetyl-CoA carboxylase biotin carboxyl carrier protein subunit n=1 Tax=Brevibacillus sp. SYP-B805 TaxID=1578199 RepID=UPI0013EA3617|nr:acetyl-CoA carboxylase biotin carboxyl carrier protein subunit [Brevibacillus sp. SYP-B805]NGQ93697.1 acetyl-CoA carboxylase biotin carboxyl carrier protein subunit [Brevibacillus sp. SYP-B805]